MVVSGFDDRTGCGYVVHTGADLDPMLPGGVAVTAGGITVQATPELAAALRDALTHRPEVVLTWSGPPVPLTLDDHTLLAWLRNTVGGVLTVRGDPGPDPRVPQDR